MCRIDFLINHPEAIAPLVSIYQQVLATQWTPTVSAKEITAWYEESLRFEIPLTLVAFVNDQVAGSCTLSFSDDLRDDLSPWLCDLIVAPSFQGQGIGQRLLEATQIQAKRTGYQELFLFILNPRLQHFYASQGWEVYDRDSYKQKPVTIMRTAL